MPYPLLLSKNIFKVHKYTEKLHKYTKNSNISREYEYRNEEADTGGDILLVKRYRLKRRLFNLFCKV
jgi:hypothetical protein